MHVLLKPINQNSFMGVLNPDEMLLEKKNKTIINL